MCHILPLIAFTHAFVPYYDKITAKDVCMSIRKAAIQTVISHVERSKEAQTPGCYHFFQHCSIVKPEATMLFFASLRKLAHFLGGDPPNPPYEKGECPLSCSPPTRAFGTREHL